MHQSKVSFKELIDLLSSDQLSPEQHFQLAEMLDQPEYRAELEEMLRHSYYHLADRTADSVEAAQGFLDAIRRRMGQPAESGVGAGLGVGTGLGDAVDGGVSAGLGVAADRGGVADRGAEEALAIVGIRRRRWYWVAAAAVLFFGSIGLYLLLPGKRASPPVVAVHTRDVLPGGNKAILVLADKTTISLDSASSGTVATQGQSNVFKSGHSLVYEPTERVAPDTAMLFNTVITPTGGQYHLVLSDGTKVWLDSRSSLQFPPAFGKGSREVKMTGQAYFEVADNPAHPFLVHVGDRTVSVLGTKFNINAFPEEGMVKTTLAEGSVKVQSEGHVLLLHPGQQAMESRQLVEHPDMEETLAWKEGLFRFNNATLPAVTRQLTRWYGVDFIYKDSVRASFVGDVPREVPLSRVLRLLELTKHVRFDINNKTITIMKY